MIMRDVARQTIDEMRDGICWLALWKTRGTWQYEIFWPQDMEDTAPVFREEIFQRLREISEEDSRAILVNSYYCNVGPYEKMTLRSLQDGLAWNYSERRNILSRLL